MIVQEKIKQISNLSFKSKITKNEEEKQELDNKVKELLVDLKKQAIESFKDESDIKKFLDNSIYLNRYSYNNQLLIHLQNPNAKYVASLKTFSNIGYRINKNEKGIKILFPSFLTFVKIKQSDDKYEMKPLYMLNDKELKIYKDKNDDTITYCNDKLTNFKIGNVFDASQTTMPIEEIEKKLNPVLEDAGADDITDIFVKTIYRDGFRVKYEDHISTGAKGYCNIEDKEIVIAKGLGNLMRLKVLIHEYTHGLAHQNLIDNKLDYQIHRNKYETEAESVAYVVSKYLGLDTRDYSLNYLYSWSKEKNFDEIDDSFSTIVNYSKKIINNFEKMLEKDKELYADDLNEIGVSI